MGGDSVPPGVFGGFSRCHGNLSRQDNERILFSISVVFKYYHIIVMIHSGSISPLRDRGSKLLLIVILKRHELRLKTRPQPLFLNSFIKCLYFVRLKMVTSGQECLGEAAPIAVPARWTVCEAEV